MPGKPDTDGEGETPPRGRDRWKQETKGIERIIDVALALDRPRTAGWVADEALVSEDTARDHLAMLADLGVLAATTARGATRYQPDAGYHRFTQVSALVEQFGRDELLDRVEDHREVLAEVEDRYGVDSPDELRAQAALDDTPVEQIQEYRTAAAEWESRERDLDLVREALERYDDFDRSVAPA